MASSYPAALPGAKTDYDNADNIASADQNAQGEDINAIAAKLGIGATTATTTNKILYGSATGTSAWAAPDTAGIVDKTSAQTLTTKTFTTPVIASFYQDAGKTKLMTTPNTASDTLAAIAATQALTNKTLTTPIIASLYQDAGKTKLMTVPNTTSDTLAAIAATQTFTNKTLTTPIVASIYQNAGKTQLMTLPNTASDTLAAIAASQTLTNKTLTSPVINVTSDAQGDVYFRNGSGAFARLAPGTSGHVLQSGGAAADPSWVAAAVPQAWSSFTPTWTATGDAPALGNGTLDGFYVQIGKTVHFHFRLVCGSTTSYGTATFRWALPVTAKDANYWSIGTAMADDLGTAHRFGGAKIVSTTLMEVWSNDGTGGWGQTVPHTWADGDSLYVNGTYEAA